MIYYLLTLPSWAKQALAIGGAVLALISGALIWLHFHDRAVVQEHESELQEQIQATETTVTETANINDLARQIDNARADEQTKGAIHDAETQSPESARAAAGPVSRAAADSLRKRASATGRSAD